MKHAHSLCRRKCQVCLDCLLTREQQIDAGQTVMAGGESHFGTQVLMPKPENGCDTPVIRPQCRIKYARSSVLKEVGLLLQ